MERYKTLEKPHHLFGNIEVSKKFLKDAEKAYERGSAAFRTFFDYFDILEADNVDEFHIVKEVQFQLLMEYLGYLEKSQNIKEYIPLYRPNTSEVSIFKDKEQLKKYSRRRPVSKRVGSKEN